MKERSARPILPRKVTERRSSMASINSSASEREEGSISKRKMSINRLALLESMLKSLRNQVRASPERKPFESREDILYYSWRLFKDKINQ